MDRQRNQIDAGCKGATKFALQSAAASVSSHRSWHVAAVHIVDHIVDGREKPDGLGQ